LIFNRKQPLFEKSGTKTFFNERGGFGQSKAPDPDYQKFFAAFLQKSRTSLSLR
jgi:hypothetical protein